MSERVYITNVHYGTASRSHILYAELRRVSDDSLCIAATLEYVLEEVRDDQYNSLRVWGV